MRDRLGEQKREEAPQERVLEVERETVMALVIHEEVEKGKSRGQYQKKGYRNVWQEMEMTRGS